MTTRFPLATSTWDEAEYSAMQDVIKSGFFTMGEKVKAFERDFSSFLGTKYGLMVSSGSTANLLMVAALFYRKKNPLKAGDEVIVPAVSWSTTYFPLHQYGLKLKFVDIDLDTLNFDLTALKSAITDKTRLIMAVNLLGNGNDYSAIKEMMSGKEITLIEDNCESMGATFEGKQLGTWGAMGTFSSFFSHHISTMEGGFVCTDDEELYHIMLCLRAHGWTRNLPKFNHVTGEKSDDPFEESFKFVLPGYNLRPLELSGAIGVEQVKKLPMIVKERRKNASYFVEKFKNHPHFIIQKELGESSWFGYSLVLKPGTTLKRKDVVKILTDAGIECRPIVAGNFAKNQVLKWMDYEIHGTLKNADWIDENGLFIGNHHYPIQENINYLFDTLSQLR
jgi:CDP-4-dehydro-6-deoxyglucose reductase, E1